MTLRQHRAAESARGRLGMAWHTTTVCKRSSTFLHQGLGKPSSGQPDIKTSRRRNATVLGWHTCLAKRSIHASVARQAQWNRSLALLGGAGRIQPESRIVDWTTTSARQASAGTRIEAATLAAMGPNPKWSRRRRSTGAGGVARVRGARAKRSNEGGPTARFKGQALESPPSIRVTM